MVERLCLFRRSRAFSRMGAKIAPAEIEQSFAFKGIKLEVDFEPRGGIRNFADEVFVLGDFQAVCVEHEVANGARLRHA